MNFECPELTLFETLLWELDRAIRILERSFLGLRDLLKVLHLSLKFGLLALNLGPSVFRM